MVVTVDPGEAQTVSRFTGPPVPVPVPAPVPVPVPAGLGTTLSVPMS